MKIYRIIVPMLLFVGVSTYAEYNPVVGWTEEGCDGTWVWASSFNGLYENYGDYNFKSYFYTSNPDVCYVFEPPVVATGTPESSTGTGGGSNGGNDGGRQGNTNTVPSGAAGPNPMDMLNDEQSDELKDCWTEALVDSGTLENWTGDYNDETWSDTGASWGVSSEDIGALGYTEATARTTSEGTTVSIAVSIYPNAIYAQAQSYQHLSQARRPTFEHLAMYTQMEERAHALQYRNEADDGDETYLPPPYEIYNMELGAAVDVNGWWRAIFGFGPPIVKSNDPPGTEHGRKKEEYQNYQQQLADDEDRDADDPDKLTAKEIKNIKKELENLTEWFEDPANLPQQQGVSGTYTSDPEEDIDCEEEEEGNDN